MMPQTKKYNGLVVIKKIATVTSSGLVKAISPGKVTITATSIDGNKKVLCNVTVNKKIVNNYIKLDDVSAQAKKLALYDIDKISKEFYNTVDDPNGETKEEYLQPDGRVNDLWRELYDKYEKELEQAINNRANIINKLINAKKSFIILIHTKECDDRAYSVREGAEKILKNSKYSNSYLSVGTEDYNGDNTLKVTKLNQDKIKGGSLVIVKNGKIYAAIDPDKDSIKNDKELKNWLSKYIDIK